MRCLVSKGLFQLIILLILVSCQTGLNDKIVDLITLDQIGYLAQMAKHAFINCDTVFDFEIVQEEKAEVVFKGKIIHSSKLDALSGQRPGLADFSVLTKPGKYFLRVNGLGRSVSFVIDDNVYLPVSEAILKMLYFQRASFELTKDFAGPWAHRAGHLDNAKIFSNPELEVEANGGWYDAGDYGRYVVPVTITIADLYLSFRVNPSLFSDNLHIPESGNGIPDLLDEVRFALNWLLKMQDKKSGGVYHKLTSLNFPRLDLMPAEDKSTQYLAPISATATACFAAICASSARIWQKWDPDFSAKLIKAAQTAWRWLKANPAAPPFKNPQGMSTGEYSSPESGDERLWAACELAALTGDNEYYEYLRSKGISFLTNSRLRSLFSWEEVLGYALAAYLDLPKKDIELSRLITDFLTDHIKLRLQLAETGYRLPLSIDEISWGSNKNLTDTAKLFWLAQHYALPFSIKDQLGNIIHYLFGANPLGICYVTGFGTKSVTSPHHRISVGDLVLQPVPGMVAGGPNKNLEDDVAKTKLSGRAPLLCYIDDRGSYATNEVTTYWNASALFALAYLQSLY